MKSMQYLYSSVVESDGLTFKWNEMEFNQVKSNANMKEFHKIDFYSTCH
jgi:hypothetical protein